MPNTPLMRATVRVTARDLLNNNVAKQFNNVKEINFNYALGKVNVVDESGSFYFSLGPMTSIVATIVTGVNGQHSFVMS